MIADADAVRLAQIGAQLAGRVRDDDPEAVARWLCEELDGYERWQLLFMLAAMVPVDKTTGELLAWFWDSSQRAKAADMVRGAA